MNPFDYLSVLLSIVIGLAITNVLAGLATLMHARERVAMYWPPLAWAIWLFFVCVQHWWAQWGVRNAREWNFAEFLLQLLVPVALFLLSSLALPPRDEGGRIDLFEWYYRNRKWMMVLLFSVPALSLADELLRTGHIWSPWNLAFLLAFEVVAVIGFVFPQRRLQEWLTGQAMVMTVVYVLLLFVRLPV